jgi:hypothetical protein
MFARLANMMKRSPYQAEKRYGSKRLHGSLEIRNVQSKLKETCSHIASALTERGRSLLRSMEAVLVRPRFASAKKCLAITNHGETTHLYEVGKAEEENGDDD